MLVSFWPALLEPDSAGAAVLCNGLAAPREHTGQSIGRWLLGTGLARVEPLAVGLRTDPELPQETSTHRLLGAEATRARNCLDRQVAVAQALTGGLDAQV